MYIYLHDRFVGKEAAIVYTMGYGTNTSTIPALTDKETLIVSDSLNHLSIVNGARASPAFIRVFRHNEPGIYIYIYTYVYAVFFSATLSFYHLMIINIKIITIIIRSFGANPQGSN
jgi:hypothetical protein